MIILPFHLPEVKCSEYWVDKLAVLITKIIDFNEIHKTLKFIIVSQENDKDDKFKLIDKYKYAKFFHLKNKKLYYNNSIPFEKNYKSLNLFYRLNRKIFANRITNKIFKKQINTPSLFVYQCLKICKQERVDIVITEDLVRKEYEYLIKKFGKNNFYYSFINATKSVSELQDIVSRCSSIEELQAVSRLDPQWSNEIWTDENNKIIYNKKYKFNKTVFVVRTFSKAKGILSCYLTFLSQFLYCEKNNYSPVVDTLTHYYSGLHNNEEEKDKDNAWDYYFKNVSDIDIRHLDDYKKVIFSGIAFLGQGIIFYNDQQITKDILKDWYFIDEKYINLSDKIANRYNNSYNKIISGKRVVGTMIREGYICIANSKNGVTNAVNINGHPVQPTLEELCGELEQKINEFKCDYIFIVAETNIVIEYLKKRFGEKVLYTNRPRRTLSSFNIDEYRKAAKMLMEESGSRVAVNYDYLEEVYLLSKCTCLYAAKCSASIVAALWNRGQYENMEIIQKGLY